MPALAQMLLENGNVVATLEAVYDHVTGAGIGEGNSSAPMFPTGSPQIALWRLLVGLADGIGYSRPAPWSANGINADDCLDLPAVLSLVKPDMLLDG